MFTEEEKIEIENYLIDMPENSSVYIGTDSVKFKKKGQWYARYTTAFIIHIASKHGGKIFHTSVTERVFDKDSAKPRMRLMREVQIAVDIYMQFADLIEGLPVEIHLDLNPDPKHNSSVVVKEALGYVMGMVGLEAKIKPASFAASHAGDRGARGKFTH